VSGLKEAGGASESLVTAIMAMARALSIDTIAEGVEVASQADCLTRLGCDMVQGYLYSRPVSADQLASLIVLLRLGELGANEVPRRHGLPLLSTEALAG
jgi:sensor c-di-GMP phosphodiesterase-like protein